MTQNLPERIDRPALERILQRATELQAAEREIGEGLTQDEVLALGREVGIPVEHLRHAILEEQSRLAPWAPDGLADRLVGPADVAAVRVVQGDADRIERALVGWLQKQEMLVIQRRQPGRVTMEPMGGVQAALRQVAAAFGPDARFMLEKADLVRVSITALEPGFCHVSLSATLRRTRGGHAGWGASLATLGIAGSGVLFALNALWLVAAAPVPAGVLLAWAVTRRYRPIAERVRLGLERALDHAEGMGVKPAHEVTAGAPGLVGLIAGEIRRALGPGSGGPGHDTRRQQR